MKITLDWLKEYFYKNSENYAISNRDYYDENGGKKAINAAFKDFTSRTLRKIDPDAKVNVNEELRKEALKRLSAKFKEYFEAPEKNKDEFNAWHEQCCKEFQTEYNKSLKGKYHEIKYGKAQKIVNMTFKYLFCYVDADNFEGHFLYCHMPLDSFTLTWYRREAKKYMKQNGELWYQDNKNRVDNLTWSDMEGDEYIKIQEDISKILVNYKIKIGNQEILLPENSLEAEFYIWQNERNDGSLKDLFKLLYALDTNFIEELNPSCLEIRLGKKSGETLNNDKNTIIKKLDVLKSKLENLEE